MAANISSKSKPQVSENDLYPCAPGLARNTCNPFSLAARRTPFIPALKLPAPNMRSAPSISSKTDDAGETAVPSQMATLVSQAEFSLPFTFPCIKPPDHSADSMPGGPSAPSLFLSECAAPSPYDSHQAMNRDSCDQDSGIRRTDDVADTELAAGWHRVAISFAISVLGPSAVLCGTADTPQSNAYPGRDPRYDRQPGSQIHGRRLPGCD